MKYSIEITSVPDRNNVVAEVWYGEDLIAEINQENPELQVQLFPSKEPLELASLLSTIQQAASRLQNI